MARRPPTCSLRLHKWAARQDENFLTESLAVVLEQLLILAPAVGDAAGWPAYGRVHRRALWTMPRLIEIRTQVETGQGRPDLEICAPAPARLGRGEGGIRIADRPTGGLPCFAQGKWVEPNAARSADPLSGDVFAPEDAASGPGGALVRIGGLARK